MARKLTSLEKILKKHKISRYAVIKALNPKGLEAQSFWNSKFAGTRSIPIEEIQQIQAYLRKQGITEIILHSPVRSLII